MRNCYIKTLTLKIFQKTLSFLIQMILKELIRSTLKTLDFKTIKKTFNLNFSCEFWEIIRSNIDSIDEAIEWHDLIEKNFI